MPNSVTAQDAQADATLSQVEALVTAVRAAAGRLDRAMLPATVFRPAPPPAEQP